MADTEHPEPSGGGSEQNGNVHVDNRDEWKKRPAQYPATQTPPKSPARSQKV